MTSILTTTYKKSVPSPSLHQGKRYQHKQQNKRNNALETTNKEGFASGQLMDKTTRVLNSTNFANNQQAINALRQEYQTTLDQYQSLSKQMSDKVSTYVTRVSPYNPYANKTVTFSTGQIAYVTNQGVVKLVPSLQIQQSVNIPKPSMDLNIPWTDSYATQGTSIPTTPPLISGTAMKYGQSVGDEGSNVFVNQLLPTDMTPTYKGCFAANKDNDNMTFIGDKPAPADDVSFENGDFNLPALASNSYTYYNGDAVPGWFFGNAALVNNSTDWGYPMPYPSGKQCVSIQDTRYISQLLQLSAGHTYTIRFYACGRPSGASQISIQLYTNQNAFISSVYSFTPQPNVWSKFECTLEVPTSQRYKLFFNGVLKDDATATAIQSIQISSTPLTTGAFNYDSCKQAAITGGYRYFGLQDANASSGLGYCAVSNDEPAVAQYGTSQTAVKLVALWSSQTSGQTATAMLSNTGSLQVANVSGQAIYSTPAEKANSTFVGCYGDKEERAMTNISNDQYVPFEDCKQLAKDGSYKYFATQNASNGIGWCSASNNLSEVTKYGIASNCTVQSGNQMGGGWSNAVYSVEPDGHYFLILEDDGNMAIYRGLHPNDNQGLIWQTDTKGKKQSANVNVAAANGKYGKNWIANGSTLSPGDFVGSTDGTTALVMQGDGNLVLYTYQVDANCQKIGNTMGGGKGANAVYDIGMTAIKSVMGRLGFIDSNADLYTYSTDNVKYADTYTLNQSSNTKDADISGASFANATVESCKQACNGIADCDGFAFDTKSHICYPKKSLKSEQFYYSTDSDIYVRDKMPATLPTGVPATTANIDTLQYDKYIHKGDVGRRYGLANATSSQKKELDQLQTRLNLISKQMSDLTGQFQTGTLAAEQQSEDNASGIHQYVTDIKNTNVKTMNVAEHTSGNVQNILHDSDIVVLQKNYDYLFWSILAAGTVLVSMNVIKKG